MKGNGMKRAAGAVLAAVMMLSPLGTTAFGAQTYYEQKTAKTEIGRAHV